MNTGTYSKVLPWGTAVALAGIVVSLALAASASALEVSGKMHFERQFGAGVITGSAQGTGDLTAGSSVVEKVATISKAFTVGQIVTGLGIAPNTWITEVPVFAKPPREPWTSIEEPDTLRLSQPAETTVAGDTLTVSEGADNVATDERQTVAIGGAPTGGSFTLSFTSPQPDQTSATSAAISYPASAAAVQGALESLPNIGSGNVEVSGSAGGPYTVEFKGRYGDTNVPQLAGSGAGLTPSGTVSVGTIQEGASAIEQCTVFSDCIPGQKSAVPGGFLFPESVAVNPTNGNVYVADSLNHRIQELTPSGAFVLMFGWNVNKSKANMGTPQEERDICTAAEVSAGAECGAGEEGTGLPGQFGEGLDVAVDPMTGNVYVSDMTVDYSHIQEFNEVGRFILMIGREVNETFSKQAGTSTLQRNVCTAVQIETEGMVCQAGKWKATIAERDAFHTVQAYGNLLAVGGPKGLLYVADEGRVAEIGATGKWEGQLRLDESSSPAFPEDGVVTGLAVDGEGDMYVTESKGIGNNERTRKESSPPGVFEFNPGGAEIGEFDTASDRIEAIALDAFGRMAVIENIVTEENGGGRSEDRFGELIELSSGEVLSQFGPPQGMGHEMRDLAFAPAGELYAADGFHQDVEMYKPLPIAQLANEPCASRTSSEFTFVGKVDPNNVANTQAWFQYGTSSAMASSTAKQPFATGYGFGPIQATITGLRPNTTYYERLAAEDKNDHAPEPPLIGKTLVCKTRAVPPAIPVEPEAFPSGASFTTALLVDKIDPENANTVYRFQYARYDPTTCPSLDECTARRETPPLESAEDAMLTVQQTLKDLQPAATYLYRLVGDNAFEYEGEPEGGETKSTEGRFTTIAAPTLTAATLQPLAVGTTTATVAGLVNADGFDATWAFEIGIDEGSGTQYGTVGSGPAGAGASPVEERLALTGLQPGTTYAYRIALRSGYGAVYGTSLTFTTSGLPDVISQPAVLAQLGTPKIVFPAQPKQGATVRKLTRAQRLADALRACRRKPRSKRRSCERAAHKRYAAKKTSGGARHRRRGSGKS